MIRSVNITNHLGDSIHLDIFKPEETGLLVEEIDGLGPAKANVVFTELATTDGAVDNFARLTTRELTLRFILIEHPTIEDSRLSIYKYFPIKQMVTFEIETDNRKAYTQGRVETVEPDIFEEKETIDVTILCPDSYFRDSVTRELIFVTIEPYFEFVYSNESLTENLTEFGEVKYEREKEIIYEGDAEVGVIIKFHLLGPVTGLGILNSGNRAAITINDENVKRITGGFLQRGDDIIINTIKGKRSATLVRMAKEYNIINALNRPVSWITVVRGLNKFRFNAKEGLRFIELEVDYDVLYEGV